MDPPWLIERRGEGYVQVTELLYRIAESLDGQHTLDEIAARVSRQTSRSVTVDNVRQLVLRQFVAKGLVPTADGRLVGRDRTSRRSLLQLSMRVRVVDAGRIDPLVRALACLFWPPVLGLTLLTGVAAQAWLYAVHGVASGVHDALYAPGLLLLTLAATVLAAAFHELGHAAALRYGGGQPSAIGAGIYIVYPAFYTDVTDNYRLGRWARVRTDLGGFYFNLLFVLGVMAAYALTRQEALLLAVTLVNLEVLRQLIPTLRFDGYWVLADLTGVPDFLSHIGGFVRSVMPFGTNDSQRLPALKPWARIVFALYLLLVVPLLMFQLWLMLRGAPRVLATAWDSAGRQVGALSQAQALSDTGGALVSAAHLLALALPALAVLMALVRVGQRVVRGVWQWSSPSPLRRAAGTALAVGAAAALAYLWLPAPQRHGEPGPPTWFIAGVARYEPIQPHERGALHDVFSDLADAPVGTATPESVATASGPTPAVGATSSAAPRSTPALTSTVTRTSEPPNARPTPGVRATATRAPVVSPVAQTATPPPVQTLTPTPGQP